MPSGIHKKVHNRCKFVNTGYCREGENYKFIQPKEICQRYLTSGKCLSFRSCLNRHPGECCYWKQGKCFRGDSCAYLHQSVQAEEIIQEEIIQDEYPIKKKKLVTFEVNGQKITASKIEEIDKETFEAMSLDDIAKFYVDDQNVEVEEINDDKEVTKYTTRDTKS